MPVIEVIIAELDRARSGLTAARNAAGDWQKGTVEGVDHTAAQRQALRDAFLASLQQGEDGIAAVKAELANP